jgi:hypothetical protein
MKNSNFIVAIFYLLEASRSHRIDIVAAQSLYLGTAHEPLPCRCSNLDP